MSSDEDSRRLRKASANRAGDRRAKARRARAASTSLDEAQRAKPGRSGGPSAKSGVSGYRTRDTRLLVSVTDGAGRPVRVPGLAKWLAKAAPRGARGVVTLALVGDRRVRALNRRYRGIDRATDVLTFATTRAKTRGFTRPRMRRRRPFLGDVVIATGIAARQARAGGHSIGTEYRLLALHGLLHLLGYDHERDGGRMASLERVLRRRGGLSHGLLERADT